MTGGRLSVRSTRISFRFRCGEAPLGDRPPRRGLYEDESFIRTRGIIVCCCRGRVRARMREQGASTGFEGRDADPPAAARRCRQRRWSKGGQGRAPARPLEESRAPPAPPPLPIGIFPISARSSHLVRIPLPPRPTYSAPLSAATCAHLDKQRPAAPRPSIARSPPIMQLRGQLAAPGRFAGRFAGRARVARVHAQVRIRSLKRARQRGKREVGARAQFFAPLSSFVRAPCSLSSVLSRAMAQSSALCRRAATRPPALASTGL